MSDRLAILTTHPIQYNAPVFRELATRDDLDVKVFYGWEGSTKDCYDPGFGRTVAWDIPLLDGYEHEFVKNVSKEPGTHRFSGIDLPDLDNRLHSWRPTSLLLYGWCFKSHLKIMRRLKGRLPILFRGDSTLLDEVPGIRRQLRRRMLRWVYRHIDVALYVGTNNRDYYRMHGLSSNQLVFAPHAIDNRRFETFESTDVEQLRQSLNIGQREIAIVFVGKFETKKAPEQLLEAFRVAATKSAHLLFVGSGELEDQLRRENVPNTHFLGFKNQSQMPAVYGAADLVALPSRGPGETWGLAMNEAMAAGRAVIAADRVGAAIDLVQPGVNGWIAKANDPSSLQQCLADAFSAGKTGLKRMGLESRRIIEDWSIEAQATAIAEVACRYSK